jgi:CubicO group peptidase (beta-lactamase class C family)
MDFEAGWPQPLFEAMGELGVGGGPPNPQTPPEPDEWIRRMGTLPLLYQPGERWLYDTGADVLGVLIARAARQPLESFLAERVFGPLGMVDTGFSTAHLDRLGTTHGLDPHSGERVVYDPPGGQWSKPPAFPSASGGLVSTLDDYFRFARMLLSGGRLPDGSRLLSRAAVDTMTTDHIGAGPGVPGPSPDGAQGWGFGVAVQVRRTGLVNPVGSYGWAGGLGSSWANDPGEGLLGIILTTDMVTGAYPPPAVIRDFWTSVYAALAG